MSEGSIIVRETDRSFGFIRTDRGNDPRSDVSTVDGRTFEILREDQRVAFVAMTSGKGARAEKVRAL